MSDQDLLGPKRQPYFAPYQIKKRNADWDAAEVTRRFNAAQLAFVDRVSDAQKPWMTIQHRDGFSSAQALVAALVAGRLDEWGGLMLGSQPLVHDVRRRASECPRRTRGSRPAADRPRPLRYCARNGPCLFSHSAVESCAS
jgi:hypothetical protein